jgi:hypothetical protein
MKSRQISFYVQQHEVSQLMAAVRDRVIPRYEALPHFLGMTVIERDVRTRAEVIVTSFWDDGLDGSEQEASNFIDEIHEVTGANPSRKAFDTLYAQVRDSAGRFQLWPVVPL